MPFHTYAWEVYNIYMQMTTFRLTNSLFMICPNIVVYVQHCECTYQYPKLENKLSREHLVVLTVRGRIKNRLDKTEQPKKPNTKLITILKESRAKQIFCRNNKSSKSTLSFAWIERDQYALIHVHIFTKLFFLCIEFIIYSNIKYLRHRHTNTNCNRCRKLFIKWNLDWPQK